jgi:DNA-binding LytR/AlgR family response regulator
MSIRALIADDEPHLSAYLAHRLSGLWPELKICGIAANGNDALQQINKEKPDIVFLDIKMPGISGIDVAARMSHPSLVVFITAYNKFAVKAFEEEAIDYLLKPVEDERLSQTIARLKQRLDKKQDLQKLDELFSKLTVAMGRKDAYLRFIRAAQGNVTHIIPVEKILFFRAMNKYTGVFTKEGEFLIRTPIVDLIRQLGPEQFMQVHRSTVVNTSEVISVNRDARQRLVLKIRGSSESLIVSRHFSHLFKQM